MLKVSSGGALGVKILSDIGLKRDIVVVLAGRATGVEHLCVAAEMEEPVPLPMFVNVLLVTREIHAKNLFAMKSVLMDFAVVQIIVHVTKVTQEDNAKILFVNLPANTMDNV